MTTTWWTFSQNNSGGFFDHDPGKGIGNHVIIEADNSDHANNRAKGIGIYFDGCDSGIDCGCCGDRWYRVSKWDGEPSPMVYGEYWAASHGYDSSDALAFIHPIIGPFSAAKRVRQE